METVKVDLRKLQILNDRINQTIDALTQLRQSVHGFQPTAGLQHSGAYVSPYAAGAYGAALPQGAIASGIGTSYGVPAALAQSAWWGPAGLSHSSFAPAFAPGYPAMEMSPWNRFVDQASAFRIAQSFPYAFAQMPPVVAL